ncbi:alpha/beta fold hydrolase [Frigoribacterium sp. 2-23]|uniref:alpha/beta fold hydrolase n=1 Tax=Frigoribacterium sp. 2-23 TaxID=3415006 RepID=UPI003C6F4A8A
MTRRRDDDDRERLDTQVRVSRVERGSMSVRVSTIGDTSNRAFVLVPGIGVSSDYFERLAPNLNEFGPVHALDLPGFAGVPHPEHALSIREYADLVGAAIDELGLDDPIVVGHSMGTQVVVELAARRSDLSTLVLIGPVVNAAERKVLTQGVRFLQASWHEPGRVKFLAVSAYLVCGFRWFSRILPKMMTFPIEERLPSVRADTLVIRGEYDAVAPRAWIERVGQLLPSSRLWEIPGAAHSVMHAHADEVARLCVEHAEQPISADEPRLVHRYDGAPEASEREYRPSPLEFVRGVAARISEMSASVRNDDDAIAEAKSRHAEAMADAFDDTDTDTDTDADAHADDASPDAAGAEHGDESPAASRRD